MKPFLSPLFAAIICPALLLCFFSAEANAWPDPAIRSLTKNPDNERSSGLKQFFNNPPVVNDDSVNVAANNRVIASFSRNDYDPDGDSLSVNGYIINTTASPIVIQSMVTNQGGFINLLSNGNYIYTPPTNFTGTDQVMYTECDVNAHSLCGTATIFLKVGTGNILPVSLSEFRAMRSGNEVFMVWVTDQEINTDHFDVQYSAGNNMFTTIATILASGNSQTALTYHYDCPSASGSENYYRIKIVDRNGKSAYSTIISLLPERSISAGPLAYPNPFRDKIELAVTAQKPTALLLQVYDINGRILLEKQVQLIKGLNRVGVNEISKFQSGNYLLKLTQDNQVSFTQVLKQ
jgi:hypothetical protein